MKRSLAMFLLLAAISSLATGCSAISIAGGSIAAINMYDLKALKSQGPSKDFAMPYDETFSMIRSKIKEKSLTEFQMNQRRGYIVVMGFIQQLNTTRVGIFFDRISDTSTRVTLTSQSSTALIKAESIFFNDDTTSVTTDAAAAVITTAPAVTTDATTIVAATAPNVTTDATTTAATTAPNVTTDATTTAAATAPNVTTDATTTAAATAPNVTTDATTAVTTAAE